VSGRSFEHLAQDLILDPLQMKGTVFSSSNVNGIAARPHEPGPPPVEVRAAEGEHLAAPGNMFATAADLARWGRAVRDGEIVSLRRSDGTMAGSVSEREVAGRPAIWMQGSITGGGATVVTFPGEDVVIVCAVNLASYPQFNSDSVVAKIAFGEDPGAAPTRLPEAPLTDAHSALSGRYVIPGLGEVRIHEEEGEMRLTLTGRGWTYYLTPAREGRLVLRKFNYTFSAIRDESGAVTGLRARLHMLNDGHPGESDLERLAE